MKDWFNFVVNHGLKSDDDFHEKRKIQISNYLISFLIALNLINLGLFTIYLWRPLLIWDSICTLVFCLIAFFLSQKWIRNFLRHFLIVATIAGLANLVFRCGEVPGFHFFILFFGCIPFFLFDKFSTNIFYFLSLLVLYLVFEVFFSKSPLQPDSELGFLYYPNMIISISLFFFIIFNFKKETQNYQNLVDAQIKDLSQLSFKLMIQKDQLALTSNRLKNKSEILEQRNKSIYDSLRLAALIQGEALPEVETVFQGIKSGFILYKPKDVVSGDFYWAKTTWQGTILVVADCIGHGVPGAMMAVLAANLISQIVDESGKSFPSDILDELDKRLRRRIKQDPNSELADGMDIAVILVGENQVSFASASRPLVKIDSKGKVTNYRGTRMQLASWRSESPEFETLELQANPGDRFYLFTDGATDQFGELTDKRLSTKKLISELERIQSQPLSIQKNSLDAFYTLWQGSQTQTDDIIVLGFET